MGGGLHAFADESIYATGDKRMYLLCAIIFEDGPADGLDALVSVKPKGAAKLHWRDVELLETLRRSGGVSGIRVSNARGEADPRLWVPDQVLGAFGDEIMGRPKSVRWSASWERVRQSVTRVDVPLR